MAAAMAQNRRLGTPVAIGKGNLGVPGTPTKTQRRVYEKATVQSFRVKHSTSAGNCQRLRAVTGSDACEHPLPVHRREYYVACGRIHRGAPRQLPFFSCAYSKR